MQPLTDFESRWLGYARAVIRPRPAHLANCVASTGASGTPELDPTIRWPGYLGSRYGSSKSRVLCVAQVHHATELLRTLGRLQGALREWSEKPEPSAEQNRAVLHAIQVAYERAIVQWGPWAKFSKILRPLGYGQRDVAYTNLAKCWQTLSDSPRPNCRKPMATCIEEYPLSELYDAIKPTHVLIMSSEGTLREIGFDLDAFPAVYAFRGRPSDATLFEIAKRIEGDHAY
jgi:hypothetical protein